MDVLELIMLADCLFAKIGQQERFDKSSRSIVLSDGLFFTSWRSFYRLTSKNR